MSNNNTVFKEPSKVIPNTNPNIEKLNINPIQEASKPEPKIIIFCIPGNLFPRRFFLCWSELVLQCVINGYRPILCQEYDKNIFVNRNKCLGANLLSNNPNQKPFQGRVNYHSLIWLDPNISFTFDDIKKLINSPYDVTTGVYTYKDTNDTTNLVKDFNYEFYIQNGTMNFLKQNDLEGIEKVNDKYFKTEFADIGLMCFKKGVAEKIEYPWFEQYTEKDVNLLTDSFSYCMKLKDNNIDIMVDTEVKTKYVELFN